MQSLAKSQLANVKNVAFFTSVKVQEYVRVIV